MSHWPIHQHEPKGKPVDIENDRLLLFLCYSSDIEWEEIEKLDTRSKKLFKYVTTVAYCLDAKKQTNSFNGSIIQFSDKDFNILGRPKERLQKWFAANNFNLLLSFTDEDCMFCNRFIDYVDCNFKVGRYNIKNISLFDFTIAHSTKDIIEQLKQYIHYLKKLNINK